MSDFFFWFWLLFGCCIIACSMAWLTKALNILAKQLGVGNDYYFLLISVAQHIQINTSRIAALEAELAAAKTVNREVLSRENDELRAINDKLRDDVVALKARIAALEAVLDRIINLEPATAEITVATLMANEAKSVMDMSSEAVVRRMRDTEW